MKILSIFNASYKNEMKPKKKNKLNIYNCQYTRNKFLNEI